MTHSPLVSLPNWVTFLSWRKSGAKTDCLLSTALLSFSLAVLICNILLYSCNLSLSFFTGSVARRPYVAVFSSLLLELLGLFCSRYLMMEITKVDSSYQTTYRVWFPTKVVTFTEWNVIIMMSKTNSLIHNALPLNTQIPPQWFLKSLIWPQKSTNTNYNSTGRPNDNIGLLFNALSLSKPLTIDHTNEVTVIYNGS